jgi:hypothetical protein
MNRIKPKRAAIFVGVFCVIAVVESNAWKYVTGQGGRHLDAVPPASRPEERPGPSTVSRNPGDDAETALQERRRREAELTAQHAQYLATYLNSDFERNPGMKRIATLAVSENGKLNRAVAAAVSSRVKSASVQIVPSLFKPQFITDGLFNQAFADSNDLFRKLELTKCVDVVLLARQSVSYTKNPALENVITANMQLEVTALPTVSAIEGVSWTFVANGAGFAEPAARAAAEERLLKQIAGDTRMNLTPILSGNPNE